MSYQQLEMMFSPSSEHSLNDENEELKKRIEVLETKIRILETKVDVLVDIIKLNK